MLWIVLIMLEKVEPYKIRMNLLYNKKDRIKRVTVY